MQSLGSVDEVVSAVEPFNTAPDGAERSSSRGTVVLYGPGIVMEIPTTAQDVRQLMVTLVDEDIAWHPLVKMAKALELTMMDPESGRTFG